MFKALMVMTIIFTLSSCTDAYYGVRTPGYGYYGPRYYNGYGPRYTERVYVYGGGHHGGFHHYGGGHHNGFHR
ncbi:hypothetical protein C1637_13725 [Chryseobacterium lactis]|uniref:Neuropeptide-like protein 29 n=2 Tax=Chryseobacterium lactis TaxID=1241981 RepID=A0A3G6RZ12_CHRLC|nr:hypothetical protein EG342_18840 [Chryseobacterium lactis]AZB07174.1 hypothetical protein EG341_09715 [Chryseobacterium lactis]PNW13260.1 hypothetical protein C1637_13725 [Chryseobacterium lactis]